MSYCNGKDLIDRFGEDEMLELSDRNNAGRIDNGVLSRAAVDAAAEVDAYLTGRYSLPLPAGYKILTVLCANIARYRLYDEQVPEVVQRNYDDAIKFLKAVANGDILLGANAARTTNGAEMDSGGRVFGRGDGAFV